MRWIGLPPSYLTFLRCLIPVLLVGYWISRQKDWKQLLRPTSQSGIWNRYTAMASMCNLSRSALYFWGFTILPVGHAILLMYTWPIMVSALATLVLKEPFRPWQLATGMIALGGVGIIHFDQTTLTHYQLWVGSAVVLMAAISNAAMLLALQKNPDTLTLSETIFVQNLAGALFFMPGGLLLMPSVPVMRTMASIGMSVIVGIGGYIFFYSALKKIPTSQASLLAYLEVFFTIIIAALFLDEPLTLTKLIGGALIITGSIGAQRFRNQRKE